MLVLEWKERAFIEKVNSRCFCWFPAAILVHQNGTPTWRPHSKLYKGVWNVWANNSETVSHTKKKDLRLGQIVYILVFCNISFSWLLPPDGFQFIFLLRPNFTTIGSSRTETMSYFFKRGRRSYWGGRQVGLSSSYSNFPTLKVDIRIFDRGGCLFKAWGGGGGGGGILPYISHTGMCRPKG